MKNNKLLYLLIVILVIWCIILSSIINKNTNNQDKTIINEYNVSGISTDFTRIVDEKDSSIVKIVSGTNNATGFVYKQNNEDIYIVTAYHAISNSNNCNIYFISGYETSAQLIGKDEYLDIAVLKINSPYSINGLSFDDSTLSKKGSFVIEIGTPNKDLNHYVELGMISNDIQTIENSIEVNESNSKYCLDVLKISSNIGSGYSGCPVLNMNGNVIGMITMSFNDTIYAITANEIKIVVESIINENQIEKHQLGIIGTYIKNMPNFEKSNLNIPVDIIGGYYINKLLDNSILRFNDIRTGDIILSINGVNIENLNNLLDVSYSSSNSLDIELVRNGENIKVTIDLND